MVVVSKPNGVYAELEIGLQRVQADAYRISLRFTDPEPRKGGEYDAGEKPRAGGLAALDLAELLALQHDPAAYGEALADGLFRDPDVRTLWARAKTATESQDHFLRVRLCIDPSAPELHALRWELLTDPETKALVATSEKTPFSRFMVSSDWRPVKLRPKADLKALVAVAAPSNLAKYQLAGVDMDGEIERAIKALEGVDVNVLGRDEPLTLELLVESLRAGVDVVYLVCHGALIRRIPRLYLQNEGGEVQVVDGNELARRIAELPQAPRLVVLASCDSSKAESAGGQPAAEAALAPRLAEAGVPAILAMQGKISMATVEKAMPAFFAELLKDGQIDRALAVARGIVRDRGDAWMPSLFLRLKRGRIWYVPGFADDDGGFSKWRSITASALQGDLVPLIGPDIAVHVYGSVRDLARRLSRRHDLPRASRESDDLAKVTQYLSVEESRIFVRDEVLKLVTKATLERRPELSSSDDVVLPSLPQLFDEVVKRQEAEDPLRILASLPVRVFVNACFDPLLVKSLKAEGRSPEALLCDWRASADSHPAPPDYDAEPTEERPVIHQLFGVLARPDSLVMTEDDFFDHLIAATQFKLIPNAVRGALTRGSLLFLGFRLDDWTFRVLFRLIMALGGKQRLRNYSHVGVQIDPEEYGDSDLEKARRHLEQYFTGRDTPPVSIYWGSPKDFLTDLRQQMSEGTSRLPAAAPEDADDWLS